MTQLKSLIKEFKSGNDQELKSKVKSALHGCDVLRENIVNIMDSLEVGIKTTNHFQHTNLYNNCGEALKLLVKIHDIIQKV